jgi:hypothetical protein
MLFAPNDRLVLEQITLWASAYSKVDRSTWLQLIIERPDPDPPGFMRVVVDGPFDKQPLPGAIAEIRMH